MLYTGHGDSGYTTAIGGPPLLKSDERFAVLGALDEAQAHLGVARAHLANTQYATVIRRIQHDMQLLMAEFSIIASPTASCQYLTVNHLEAIESDLARWDDATGGFLGFSIPGDSIAGAYLHLARTVIRRAERHVVALAQKNHAISPIALTYLNRLSSWVFALALFVEHNVVQPSTTVAA